MQTSPNAAPFLVHSFKDDDALFLWNIEIYNHGPIWTPRRVKRQGRNLDILRRKAAQVNPLSKKEHR
eukprot:scaffold6847_cov71-Cylindrotheca_fusiformis.AAC.1